MCLSFISFYKEDAHSWIESFFVFFLFFTGICLYTTQNMFSALKPKPLSSTLLLLLRWKINKQQITEA